MTVSRAGRAATCSTAGPALTRSDGGEDGGLGEFFGSFRNYIWGDTATYVHSDAGVTIDLAAGTAEGGHADGDMLTGIESVRASDHADVLVARPEGSTLYGQRGDDSLTGGDGPDYLWGGKGDDTLMAGASGGYLEGGAGADMLDGGSGFDWAGYELSDAGVTINLTTGQAEGGHAQGDILTGIEGLVGSSHADRLTGDAGVNVFDGGAGADTLDGGDGWDQLAYFRSDAGVTVNLATGEAEGGSAEGDVFTGFETVWGSRHADRLIGDGRLVGWLGNDTLEGATGNGNLEGHAGADMLDGGDGWDTAAYNFSDAGVTVNLTTGTGQGGHAEGDTLTNIEGINGSEYADHLTGDEGSNGLDGGPGADMIDGGEGYDHAGYWRSDAGVTVNLATGTGQGGYAEGDTLTSIEQLHGSNHADHLTGDDGDNRLYGRDGDDTLDGGAGDDALEGDAGNDMLVGGAGNDNLVGGEGADVLAGGDGYDTADYGASDAGISINLTRDRAAEGGHAAADRLTGIENIYGSSHADRLVGDRHDNDLQGREGNDTLISGAGNDNLHGGAGADRLDGGADWDHAGYWGSDAGVTVNLATGTGAGGHAQGDTFIRIENLSGSDHADHLTGDDGDNWFSGDDGNDTLEGGAGNDTLEGGDGADVLDGGDGEDHAGYWGSDAGVTVNLATGTGQGGHAEGDTLTSIERIHGSDHADHLTARDDDPDTEEAEGSDLHASDGNDTLQGGTGTDHLEGGAGADVLDGGDGDDYAAYWGSDAGVTVNLATGTAEGGHAEGDRLTGIERIHGSDHADHLTGDDGGNAIHGGNGNDILEGGAGDDWLSGEAGEDLLTGGEGADSFVFGDGDTVTDFEDGSDLIGIYDLGHVNADNFETEVTIRQSGDDVEVQIGDAVLTLTGVSAADITMDDFALA